MLLKVLGGLSFYLTSYLISFLAHKLMSFMITSPSMHVCCALSSSIVSHGLSSYFLSPSVPQSFLCLYMPSSSLSISHFPYDLVLLSHDHLALPDLHTQPEAGGCLFPVQLNSWQDCCLEVYDYK